MQNIHLKLSFCLMVSHGISKRRLNYRHFLVEAMYEIKFYVKYSPSWNGDQIWYNLSIITFSSAIAIKYDLKNPLVLTLKYPFQAHQEWIKLHFSS